jgi:acyl-CoA thioester hydrolase
MPYIEDMETGLVWHRCAMRTLYADTDRADVVYHANYLRYFEFGRSSLMRDMSYPYKAVEASGYVYPIIDLAVTFLHPLHYDDPMFIHTRPVKMERIKLQFDYIITHAESGIIICKGFTKHCALNSRGIPTAVDAKTRALWQSFPNKAEEKGETSGHL